jgi:NADH-quinone oxidoreductase subunit J
MSLSRLVIFLLFYSLLVASIFQVVWYQPEEIMEVSTPALGHVIFNLQGYVVPFEVLSLVLLAAMIGALFIAKEESR